MRNDGYVRKITKKNIIINDVLTRQAPFRAAITLKTLQRAINLNFVKCHEQCPYSYTRYSVKSYCINTEELNTRNNPKIEYKRLTYLKPLLRIG